MEQELLTLPENISSPPVFTGVNVTHLNYLCILLSTILCPSSFDHCVVCPSSFDHCVVCPSSFDHCVVCPFSFDHCVVSPSSIFGVWLPPWYLQSFLIQIYIEKSNINLFSILYLHLISRRPYRKYV